MRLLAILLLSLVLFNSCSTPSAAPAIKSYNFDFKPEARLSEPNAALTENFNNEFIEAVAIDENTQATENMAPALFTLNKKETDLEPTVISKANSALVEKNTVIKKVENFKKEKYTVSYANKAITINDVSFLLESSYINKIDKTTKEARILNNLAKQESTYFKSNIVFRAKDVTRKLMGKYEYELYIKNQNRILTLDKIELKIEYLGKKNEDLGSTRLIRKVDLQPGESTIIDWGVDWAFLEDGTRKCAFTVSDLENNIEAFRIVVDVN